VEITRILAPGDIVGESAVWSVTRQSLLWVDIIGRRIQEWSPGTGAHRIWTTPDLVTSIGLRRDGGAVVGLRAEVALWDFGAVFAPLARPEPDRPDNRLNEGRVGPDGAFWVGTMQDNIAADDGPKPITASTGAFHRVWPDGRVESMTPAVFGICNTMAWDDQGRFLCADTLANSLIAYDWSPRGLSRPRPFARHDRGLPDGSALDAAGGLWNARVGGARVVRFAPDGTVTHLVELPCAAPTSCALGGRDLRTLYVTSARFGLPPAQAREPDQGAVFAIEVETPGRAEHLFG